MGHVLSNKVPIILYLSHNYFAKDVQGAHETGPKCSRRVWFAQSRV
jgi:hypothetical protein